MSKKQYENMVEKRILDSTKKKDFAIETIKEMVTNGERVTETILSHKTGLSRSFFYNNTDVKEVMKKAKDRQKGKDFYKTQRCILDKALQAQITRLESENKALKDKLQESRKQVEEQQEIIAKYNMIEYIKINPYKE